MKREVLRFLATLVQLLPFFFASSHDYSSGIAILPFRALMYVLGQVVWLILLRKFEICLLSNALLTTNRTLLTKYIYLSV